MLTGIRPWKGIEGNIIELLEIIGKTTSGPKYPGNISTTLKEFLDLCFIIDKYKRPSAYQLLIHQFISQISIAETEFILNQISLALKSKSILIRLK